MSGRSGKLYRSLSVVIVVMMLLSVVGGSAFAAPAAAPAAPISFAILHTNDFHGQLEASGSNPGMARVSAVVNDARTALGAANVLLVDAGDEMQGSLLSNLQKGAPVIATYNLMEYGVATFGNHEFDWGQENLAARTTQATYPYVTANIVKNDTGNCSTAGWTKPDFAAAPYVIKDVAGVKVAFIGVTTQEVPTITIAAATEGLCFKDPAASITHYYDAMKADGANVVAVLSHLGFNDGGYGYGIPIYGDKTLAQKLIDAGKPADIIIGGHSHTDLSSAGATVVGGKTTIGQAYYNGRQVGRFDVTFDPDTQAVTVKWSTTKVSTTGPEDPAVKALITQYATDPAYVALINQPIGYAQVDLLRDYNGDNMMGNFIDDAIYGALNSDSDPANDMDMFFNNAGGIRAEWCDKEDPANPGQYIWSSTAADCQKEGIWNHDPMLLNYGQMFTVLPFGNATVVGTMTGAQILEVLHQSATLGKGAIQPAGMRYSFYRYADSLPGPQPYAWGAYNYCVINKATKVCEPLDMAKTYKVGTNEFLAPAGGDNYSGFKYMKNITYWGDMLNAVNAYVTANYTQANPYKGPDGDGKLDGRIMRNGTDAGGEVVPVTVLHHNDSHGRLVKTGNYQGWTQLATIIKQERAHNPNRTLLFSLGDNIQGDSMAYYFKNAGAGLTADNAALPPSLWMNPIVAVMNSLGYNGMVLGNHEFNFGAAVFQSAFSKSAVPLLGANMSDTGAYGVNKVGLNDQAGAAGVKVNVYDGLEFKVPSGTGTPIKVGFLGLTNHRVPNYELPSNIPGLSFYDPLDTAKNLVPVLNGRDDAVVALTHIGFTEDPKSVEVDKNVDTNLALTVPDIDAIIGSHSHTNPTSGFGAYKYLPTYVAGPNNVPVLINQAYRYNTFLGEVVLGFLPKAGGGWQLISTAGRDVAIDIATAEDATVASIVAPYQTIITAYNNTVIGKTVTPIDALKAFTEETNGANLQADAAVAELRGNNIKVDFHLSGAMTNSKIAADATATNPVDLKVSDMFTAMPYENSLLVLKMNGPQLKAVLERAYRNYYYYKYVPGYGGYSYYTTCMIDTDKGNVIKYADLYPALPTGNNVVSLTIHGTPIDFTDANTYYNVSTVNYLAAGSCNFNDAGKTLWPLDQIVADTQYYVRDAVINYVKAQTEPINPQIEGRLAFQNTPPLETLTDTFIVSADTHISKGQPTVAFGAWPQMYIGANDGLRGLMSFNLSGIANSATVKKATLKVYFDAFSGGGSPANLEAFEVLTPWQQATATWNAPWAVKGGDVAGPVGSVAVSKTDTGKWVQIDVTSLVQKWVTSPAANNGVMLKLADETSFTQYRMPSSENWNKSLVPMLDVTYEAPAK